MDRHVLLSISLAILKMLGCGAVKMASSSFHEFMTSFGRDYTPGSPEYVQRMQLFNERVEQMMRHNAKPDRLWTAGLSALSDRTDEELSMLRGWKRGPESGGMGGFSLLAEKAEILKELPESVDWSHLATFQPSIDQAACGSCWAVAAAGMLQAHNEIHIGNNRTFSAQQLVDCVPNPHSCGGTGGCEGATVELAVDYVNRVGLKSTEDVPYVGVAQKCNDGSDGALSLLRGSSSVGQRRVSTGLQGWSKLPENQARPLMQALLEGPVAISVSAEDWAMYRSGIFDGCPRDSIIDHAVLLLGYGKDASYNYWTVQNSWGNSWGEDGRIRLLRHNSAAEDDDFCGTDNRPADGTSCQPYPDSVRVCGMCGLLYDSVTVHFTNPI